MNLRNWLAAGTSGALAGVGATVLMSGVMLLAGRLGVMGEQPPRKVMRRVLNRPPFVDSDDIDLLASAAHMAFGAGAGATFGLIVRRAPGFTRPWLGALFGLLIWIGSYAGWIPALHIMQPPHRDRKARQATMLAAHLVFGLALGQLTRVLRHSVAVANGMEQSVSGEALQARTAGVQSRKLGTSQCSGALGSCSWTTRSWC